MVDSVRSVSVGDTPSPSEESGAYSRKAASEVPDLVAKLESLDLSHVHDPQRRTFRDMLHELTSMWNGYFRKIGITEHWIALLPCTRPVAQHPYLVNPTAR